MNDRPAFRQLSAIARRWHALAEQRRAHFADLYRSGRWRRYYTEEEFLVCIREVAGICERWARIVEAMPAEPAAQPVRRDAA